MSPEGDAVARLFGERQRLEGWLSALDNRRVTTPPHIYERVRSDYEGRLRGVVGELRTHRAAMQSMAETMDQRLAVLKADEARHQDDRSEAELRQAIGELEPEASRGIVQRAEEAIATIESERGSINPELSRLREVLMSTAEPPPHAAHREAAPAARAVPAAASNAPAAQPAKSGSPAAFDELEFLKSVVVDTRGGGSAPTETPPRESFAGNAPAATSAANGARVSGSVPAFLRDVPSEQTKTLKCQECGTMNYPTEWYCERCGAELAAL